MLKNTLSKLVVGVILLFPVSSRAQSTDLISLSDPAAFGPLVTSIFTGTGSQGASGWVVNGAITGGDVILGDIASAQNWSTLFTSGASEFRIWMNIVSPPSINTSFSLEFLDSGDGSIDIWSAVTGTAAFSGPISFGLIPSSSGTGDYSDVKKLVFTWANASPETINTVISKVDVIPEPSTYALLVLGGLAVGGYAIRRRSRV